MRNSTSQAKLASSRQTTTVFTSGNSQAVRLPKAFRFDSKTVEIERRGNEIILREKKQTVGDILRHLPPLSGKACEEWERFEALMADQPPQERDWDALLGSKADGT
ncbi:MAG: AbrB/MazE/SpoVT family DNA-binding domain-containing protein [Pseudomonas fluorescens]|nr:AbrB/MazE/SpoVT family DNA-binding domain-containing protein [Pseudomonas fluorescens]